MATVPQGMFMGQDGLDPRNDLSESLQEEQMTSHDVLGGNINSQPLEVYLYYAAIERAKEDADPRPIPDAPWIVLFKKLTGKSHTINYPDTPAPHYDQSQLPGAVGESGSEKASSNEKNARNGDMEVSVGAAPPAGGAVVEESEHARAYRALRVASWQAVFYLITTDILGFSSAPLAFAELGYGPGVLVYTFFYILAFGAGQIIWRMYMRMDSERFPVKCYADIGERTFGKVVRHIFNILQSLQILFNVGILLIGNGQTLASLINYQFCYIALIVFFTILGMVFGQVRSLRNFAWFANLNIWINILVMVMTMVGVAKYLPVPSQSGHTDLSDPIQVTGWVPGYTAGWYAQVTGVQLAVFSYGGAMIFTEFMAEMRRPRDFWKSAFVAQLFCYLMYMFFGLFCYSFQGQYSSIIPSLDFANQGLSLATNIISLFNTTVAAVLYANIGVKVFYQNVLREYFHAPDFTSSKGRWYWSASVIVYWAVAWILGSAIPNITSLVTLIGAACILQFTYTFPPILLCAYWMQIDAMKGDTQWQPGMAPGSGRVDTWRNASRWKRGFRPYWYLKTFLILLFLAAMCLAALGIYAGVEDAIAAFASSTATAFSCIAPGQPTS
ncbi:hypothetical protein EHS25_007428 [Saitozyma podzolica]|uniref:Amino acid transporter transmembrane domain-containing protein n=1 Tax=Saitozyma podzolica TaxID=1890683 RepID=A0A427YPT0_9TREE|nr:hypothetical protein EHS25_007428 [Saitozyma podzolica]